MAEFNRMKAKLTSFKNGKPVDDFEDDDEENSDVDPEYEENAGEYALYDSPLEETDELIAIKQTLDEIYQIDQNAYQYITSTQTD
jgi:hypothetical protein